MFSYQGPSVCERCDVGRSQLFITTSPVARNSNILRSWKKQVHTISRKHKGTRSSRSLTKKDSLSRGLSQFGASALSRSTLADLEVVVLPIQSSFSSALTASCDSGLFSMAFAFSFSFDLWIRIRGKIWRAKGNWMVIPGGHPLTLCQG